MNITLLKHTGGQGMALSLVLVTELPFLAYMFACLHDLLLQSLTLSLREATGI